LNVAYISNDIEKLKDDLLMQYDNIVLFEDNELKLALVREIKEEAYKTTNKEKIILIKAISLRIESQNALLKLLEESPEKIRFFIITTSKYSLLDTIRSRMEIKQINYELPDVKIDLNIDRLTTKNIYETLKKEMTKQELKLYIQKLLKEIKTPNQRVLDNFELAIKLVDLNGDKQALLSLLLLSIRENNGNI